MFKRFAKNKQNKYKIFEYMIIDYVRIIGVLGKKTSYENKGKT